MPTWLPPALFITLLLFALAFVPWHYAGYFNGRYERWSEEAHGDV